MRARTNDSKQTAMSASHMCYMYLTTRPHTCMSICRPHNTITCTFTYHLPCYSYSGMTKDERNPHSAPSSILYRTTNTFVINRQAWYDHGIDQQSDHHQNEGSSDYFRYDGISVLLERIAQIVFLFVRVDAQLRPSLPRYLLAPRNASIVVVPTVVIAATAAAAAKEARREDHCCWFVSATSSISGGRRGDGAGWSREESTSRSGGYRRRSDGQETHRLSVMGCLLATFELQVL
mmetsp:Transcript_5759/g.9724  ORF Transcript_5759/g.9724 Transcript_5759/m.9724 type:complete len:234 (+) Transcript_5759:39-740(+)